MEIVCGHENDFAYLNSRGLYGCEPLHVILATIKHFSRRISPPQPSSIKFGLVRNRERFGRLKYMEMIGKRSIYFCTYVGFY